MSDNIRMPDAWNSGGDTESTPAADQTAPVEPLKVPANLRLANDETPLFVMRTHPKVLALRIALGVFLLAVGITYQVTLGTNMPSMVNLIVGIILFSAATYYCIWPWLKWYTTQYVITTRQIVTLSGILHKRTHSSQIARISDINVERHLMDRVFGCGTIVILNASGEFDGGGQNRVTLVDVPKVLDVEDKLKDMVFRR